MLEADKGRFPVRQCDMVRKGQMRGVEKGDILGQVAFIARLFGVAA
jgi:hypothetical protein